MYSFSEWAEHYGYTDSEQARQDYQRYLDNLALVQALTKEGQQ